MIVRENEDVFTMIEQHQHARLAGDIMTHWEDRSLEEHPFSEAVMTAIVNHDRGWRMFDQAPFWDDEKGQPYAFTDFPTHAKTALYRQGIDEVEEMSLYAALLCSVHYCRFMNNSPWKEAKQFIDKEQLRQQKIVEGLSNFDQAVFSWHYELLKFADNMSLYICLNEPGVAKEQEHPFFKEGIPAVSAMAADRKIDVRWENKHTIWLSPYPFTEKIETTIKLKKVSKKTIAESGIVKAYQETAYEEMPIQLSKKS